MQKFLRKHWWKIGGIFMALCLSGGIWYHQNNATNYHFQITFFSIGQGDASFIEFRDGKRMLVDCGPDQSILAKLGNSLPFFDRRIDYLVITHPDLDHYGGCSAVLRRFEVKQVITNDQTKPDDSWQELENSAQDRHAQRVVMKAPTTWVVASTTLQFLSPDTSLSASIKPDDTNNHSIVFRLLDEPTKNSVLFMADAEESLEQAILKKYCLLAGSSAFELPCSALIAKILKVGHHGSDTSSGEVFLRAVNPVKAIISVGKNNHFGHPSRRVLNRLIRQKVTVLRTDEDGDILEQ